MYQFAGLPEVSATTRKSSSVLPLPDTFPQMRRELSVDRRLHRSAAITIYSVAGVPAQAVHALEQLTASLLLDLLRTPNPDVQ